MRRQVYSRSPRSLARTAVDAIVFLAAAALILFSLNVVQRTLLEVPEGAAQAIDGDSLRQGDAEIRLHGIDAPEYQQACRDRAGAEWPCGRQASYFLQDLVRGKTVVCTSLERDRYQRIVASCEAGGIRLNREMVKEGWAIAYRRHSTSYVASEEEARRARRGIWAGTFDEPETWRERQRTKRGAVADLWD